MINPTQLFRLFLFHFVSSCCYLKHAQFHIAFDISLSMYNYKGSHMLETFNLSTRQKMIDMQYSNHGTSFQRKQKNSNESGFTFPLKSDTCVMKKKKLLRKKFFRINLGEIRHQIINVISFYIAFPPNVLYSLC